MNKVYPLTAGIGIIAVWLFAFILSALQDARAAHNDRRTMKQWREGKPTPVPEEDYETVVAPTG